MFHKEIEDKIVALEKRVRELEYGNRIIDSYDVQPWVFYGSLPSTIVKVWVERILAFLKSEGYTYETYEAGGKWIKEED